MKTSKITHVILPRHCLYLWTDVIVIDHRAKQHWGGGVIVWQWFSQIERNAVKVNHGGGVVTANNWMQGCLSVLICVFSDFGRSQCVPVCGASSVHPRLLLLLLHPHTLWHWRRSVFNGLVAPPTPFHSLLVSDGHGETPVAPVPLTGCVASSSHDGALLCTSPRDSWEIEGLCVKVKSWWLGEKRQTGGMKSGWSDDSWA